MLAEGRRRLECDTLPCAIFQRSQALNGLYIREPRAETWVSHGDGTVLRGLFRRLSFFLCEHLHGPDHHHFPGRRREGADRPGPGQEPGTKAAMSMMDSVASLAPCS